MRLGIMIVAAALGVATTAGAQWTTQCVRYTARIRTCSARYVAPPMPARSSSTASSQAARASIDVESLDEQDTVLGIWRATGVVFESRGERTMLEARVAPLVYRGADQAGRVTTFRVAGGRAELAVTGARGDGLVTWQFDEHEARR